MASFNPLTFEKMSEQYEFLLKSGNLSDVVLVAGEKELKVHKSILSARSPVFAAMFAHNSTKEAQENRVEIADVDVEVLELFARFIYTGKVEALDQFAADLLIVADKYQLESLKSICERQLLSEVLTTESVSNLHILADMHQATELTTKCLDYINENGTHVMDMDGWKKLRVKLDLVDKHFEHLNLEDSKDNDEKKGKLITMQNSVPLNMVFFDQIIFEEISENYESLLKSGDLSDFVLVVSGKEIRVHKVILSARSPVFAAMFAHDSTKEAQENRVEIVDVDLEVLKLLVRYIYTGKIEQLDQYAAELLITADKYQLDSLKSICEERLLSEITTKSVSDLLIFADMYQVTELYTECIHYIINNGTRVVASKTWKKIFLRADLLAKLCERLIVMLSELSFSEQQVLSPINAETISDRLIFSHKHQVTNLTTKYLEYIAENGARVMASEGWKKVVIEPDLLVKIFQHLYLKYHQVFDEQ